MAAVVHSSSDESVRDVGINMPTALHSDASHATQEKIRILIVGCGAMGLLHAWFLERAGHEVAILARPGTNRKKLCGVALSKVDRTDSTGISLEKRSKEKSEQLYINPLNARCVDVRGALAFLKLARRHGLSTCTGQVPSCILIAVKAHQIKEALRPLFQTPRNNHGPLPPVVMLHNGLIDSQTQMFIDRFVMPRHSCYHMITGACATLLSKGEIEEIVENATPKKVNEQTEIEKDAGIGYVAVARPTGLGLAFIFPRLSRHQNEKVDICGGDEDLSEHDRRVLNAMVCVSPSPGAKDRGATTNSKPVELLNVAKHPPAIPKSYFLTTDRGRAEQMVKLSVNVSLNGLLSRRALSTWYTEVTKTINGANDIHNLVEKGTAALSLIRRVVNHEVRLELPLACKMARLVMRRALRADPNNVTLKEFVINDIAALRTVKTLDCVPNHICSTVVDICNGRMTERVAMFSPVVNEWNNEVQKNIEEDETASVLSDIFEMLSLWDEYVCACGDRICGNKTQNLEPKKEYTRESSRVMKVK